VTSRVRRTGLALAAAAACGLALPASAWAHAALLRTTPEASGTIPSSPARVTLTYDEAVAPKFAVVSVTNAAGRQEAAASPAALPSDPDTIAVPVRHLPEGWYLVYWRVISADGHPVRGAFTFAVGPNPGPAPQFVIPSLSESATSPQLIVTRWLAFLGLMLAVGMFALRAVIARPGAAVNVAPLRALSKATAVAVVFALLAIPVYVLVATAEFAQRPVVDLAATVPVVRDSNLGRSFTDLEAVLALFAIAAWAVLWVDDGRRRHRSVAALLALTGALLAAAAATAVPGLAGHAAQTSPAALSLVLDWTHVTAAAIWLGGLLGVILLAARTPAAERVEMLGLIVPRFSNTALVCVLLVIASGVAASILHLPTLSSLWGTSYGKAILVKVALLACALVAGGMNYARTVPRLAAARERGDRALAESGARLLRRNVGTEVVLVTATLLAAMVLSSLPPPAKALAEVGQASAHVGPGAVERVIHHGSYTLAVHVDPNRAAQPSTFTLRLTQNGKPVTGARVTLRFAMLDMEMGTQAYTLPERSPGTYVRTTPALVMVGHWGVSYQVEPQGAQPFTVIVVDHAEG
jgi:copper transport protein